MDTNRLKGAARKITGAVKEGAGKLTGNTKLRAKGAAEKNAGKVQEAAGNVKDAARKAAK